VQPPQRVDQPRGIELEGDGTDAALHDLIAIDSLRRATARRLLEQRDVADARHAPVRAEAVLLVDHERVDTKVLKRDEDGQELFSMFVDLQKYHWLLKPVIEYSSVDRLILARLANVTTS
jgi:hypothetical protein